MKLQQLEYVLAIVDHDLHLSAAASALRTSQPGVSRQLRQLECELGVELFHRTKNRIIELTEAGEALVEIARRIVGDMGALKALDFDAVTSNRSSLTIATTHAHARYTLPNVIASFIEDFPNIHITLMPGNVESINDMVRLGEADIAIGTESLQSYPDLVSLPGAEFNRILVAPVGHPILDAADITLETIAKYPLITYNTHFTSYWKVASAFERAGLTTNVVLSAIDADVCKTYVQMGIGISILSGQCVDEVRDPGLRIVSVAHLFDSSMTFIRMRPSMSPRPCLLEFVHRFAPQYSHEKLAELLGTARIPDSLPVDAASTLPRG